MLWFLAIWLLDKSGLLAFILIIALVLENL